MRRWLRSLHAQLFLWAVLPITFVIIALAFTGVYTHQRTMRDFVAERDLALVHVTARMVEDGLAYGVIGVDGSGLAAWLQPLITGQPKAAELIVVNGEGRVLGHSDPQQIETDLSDDVGVAEMFQQRPFLR